MYLAKRYIPEFTFVKIKIHFRIFRVVLLYSCQCAAVFKAVFTPVKKAPFLRRLEYNITLHTPCQQLFFIFFKAAKMCHGDAPCDTFLFFVRYLCFFLSGPLKLTLYVDF